MGKLLLNALEPELSILSDEDIKKFVGDCLEWASDYNAVGPASSSGKFHPQHDLGYGGLIRHTRATCMMLLRLFQAHPEYKNSSIKAQIILGAAILHDMCKFVDNDGLAHTQAHHPVIMATKMRELAGGIKSRSGKANALRMADVVEAHMSEWGTWKLGNVVIEARKPESMDDFMLVHADMLASAVWLHIDFDRSNMVPDFK